MIPFYKNLVKKHTGEVSFYSVLQRKIKQSAFFPATLFLKSFIMENLKIYNSREKDKTDPESHHPDSGNTDILPVFSFCFFKGLFLGILKKKQLKHQTMLSLSNSEGAVL